MRIYILLLTLLLTLNSVPALAVNPWDFCVALVSKVGILNNKKILSQAILRLIPDKQKPMNSEFIKTINNDPKDLPTQQLQENLTRLKKLKNENNLSASEKAVFGGLISKMEIESAARTKVSSEAINKLKLNKPLSIDRTVDGKNAMIEDLNSLIEARKNPLLTKQDKEKISSRIQKLLDSPHEDNPKLAAENNYYFDEFLSKQKGNLEPAELGKALNRKTTHADNFERQSFELAEKTAFPNGLGEDGRGKSLVNAIMSRMGKGFDQTTKIPLDSKEDLTAAATYVNKLIEAQRKNPNAGVNPKHLNQMLANLESLAQAQGTSLDSLLKAPQLRKSISDKFPSQRKNITKIFNQIDSGEKIPSSFKEHEELLKTIEDLYASKKLSPDEIKRAIKNWLPDEMRA